MKHLLYIGNKLAVLGNNPTGIDTLGLLLEKEGYRLSYASSQKNKALRFLDMMVSVCISSKIDYVLIDTYSTTNFWYAYWVSRICRVRKIKYIPILHGGNLPQRWITHPRCCTLLFGQAYKNVCPSFYLLRVFQEVDCPNLVTIPNALLSEQYLFTEREQPKPKLLWVRAFSEIYNPMMAIEVLAEVCKTYPNAELCMVGPDKDGSLEKTKKRVKELGLNVSFPGYLSKKDWKLLSQEYDFLINTTHFDNTPVSVIEAMHLGLAVISTNVGGIPFLINHARNGWLVNVKDSISMSEIILYLLNNPKRYIESTKEARKSLESFNWDNIKKDWQAILK